MLDLQRPSGELSESELLFDAASDVEITSSGLRASALTAAFAGKDAGACKATLAGVIAV